MTPPSVARPAAPAPPAAELEWTYYLASVWLGFSPLYLFVLPRIQIH